MMNSPAHKKPRLDESSAASRSDFDQDTLPPNVLSQVTSQSVSNGEAELQPKIFPQMATPPVSEGLAALPLQPRDRLPQANSPAYKKPRLDESSAASKSDFDQDTLPPNVLSQVTSQSVSNGEAELQPKMFPQVAPPPVNEGLAALPPQPRDRLPQANSPAYKKPRLDESSAASKSDFDQDTLPRNVLSLVTSPPACKKPRLDEFTVTSRSPFDKRPSFLGEPVIGVGGEMDDHGKARDFSSNEEPVESPNGDGGIFDDADEDVDLPLVFQAKPRAASPMSSPCQSPVNIGKVHRHEKFDSDDEFEDAADDIAVKSDISDAKDADSSKLADDSKKKKEKQKRKKALVLTKPIAAPSAKETKRALNVLKDKTDLTRILPEAACRFLGERFWIFTLEQFQHLFSSGDDACAMKDLREEIRNELAKSDLCGIEKTGQETETVALIDSDKVSDVAMHEHDSSSFVMEKIETRLTEDIERPAEEGKPTVTGSAVTTSVTQLDSADKDTVLERELDTANRADDIDPFVERFHIHVEGTEEDSISGAPGPKKDPVVKQGTGNIIEEGKPKIAGSVESCFEVVSAQKQAAFTSSQTLSEAVILQAEDDSSRSCNTGNAEVSSPTMSHMDGTDDEIKSESKTQDATELISGDRLKEADVRLQQWRSRIALWKADEASSETGGQLDTIETSFSLQGPVGLLFPQVIRNFLSTISVSSVYEFLRVRVTEASPLVFALTLWRKQCGLEPVKRMGLARHLAGIMNRVETALVSVPPADSYTRKWMGSCLASLTGAAKDFLIDECKLENHQAFVDTTSKVFADKLVMWREEKSMPTLKGSGKVAMISSWKASIRETIIADQGEGTVISEDEIIALSKKDAPVDDDDVPKAVTKKSPKKKPDKAVLPTPADPKKEAALKSTEFLQKVLRQENVDFLANMGIHTPEQLILADKQIDSPLVVELVKFRTQTIGTPAMASSAVRLLFDWSFKVKAQLELVGTDKEKTPEKKRGPKLTKESAKPKTVPEGTELKKSEATQESVEQGSLAIHASSPSKSEGSCDAIESLSIMALTFLATIGITTADEFLSAKSSYIANNYIEWRETMKMNPLKGSGAIATVSGWKGVIRKAQIRGGKKERTQSDVTPSRARRAARLSADNVQEEVAVLKRNIDHLSHPDVLEGLPRRRFFVRNDCGECC